MRTPLRDLVFWAIALGFGAALPQVVFAQAEYILQVPGRNDLNSSASVSETQLSITDAQGQTFVYERAAQLDSADGRYWGFYSQAAGQSLRWPANNAGSMMIGTATGQNWRQSRQQIQPARPAVPNQPNVVTARRPVMNRNDLNLPAGNVNAPPKKYSGPMEVAYTSAGENSLDVGYIGQQGDLQLYRGYRDQWQPQQVANDQLRQQARLVPGAPLRLVSQQGQALPSAYTVDGGGQLVEIQNGNQVRPVAGNLQFAPRSSLNIQATNQGPEGFAVDAQGRLWDLDLTSGQHQVIDQNQGRFAAGSPVSLVSHQQGRGLQDLFLVDTSGQIVNYNNQGGRWNGPQTVAAGFPAGAPITAEFLDLGGRSQLRLAGVDVRGQVQTLGQTQAGWQALPVSGAVLPPGSPVAFTQSAGHISLSGIGAGGVWNDWDYLSGRWTPSVVTRGFTAGAPLVADPYSQTAFGVDATGRLIAGGYWDDAWHSHLLLPGIDYAPALVRRTIAPNVGFKPAQVFFDNPGPEELVLQMVDPARGPIQFNVPPGGSTPQLVPRDGGGTLQEVYLVPDGFGGFVERVDSFPLPPQPGPTVVVWSKRVTYTYIDKKRISVVPDFDLKTHVSLGVFDLPPGAYLQDGDRFDVLAEAVVRRNPGAAQFFGTPAPDPDIGVPLIRDYGQNPQQGPPQRIPPRTGSPRNPAPAIPPAPEETPRQENPVLPPLPE